MPLILMLLLLLLGGCSGTDRGVSLYLRQVDPYQASLADYKTQMGNIQGLPQSQRADSYKALAYQVKERQKGLDALKPPPSMQPLHADTQELYSLLAQYLERAAQVGGPDDPQLKELAQKWQDTAARAQSRLK